MAALADTTIHTLGAEQRGLVTYEQLLERGLTAAQIQARIRAKVLMRLHRGVYAIRATEPSFERRVLAAQLAAGPEAVVSHWSAGQLHGVRGMGREQVHLTMPSRLRRRVKGVRIHYTDTLRKVDVEQRDDGINVMSPLRWLFSMADLLTLGRFHDAAEDARNKGLLTIGAARDFWVDLHERGRNGSALFGDYFWGSDPSARPTQSRNELRVVAALRERGVDVVPQHPVVLPDGSRIRLDVAILDSKVDVECDIRIWHGSEAKRQADLRRDAALASLGWLPARYDDERLAREFDACIDEIVRTHHRRLAPIR